MKRVADIHKKFSELSGKFKTGMRYLRTRTGSTSWHSVLFWEVAQVKLELPFASKFVLQDSKCLKLSSFLNMQRVWRSLSSDLANSKKCSAKFQSMAWYWRSIDYRFFSLYTLADQCINSFLSKIIRFAC